MVKIIKRRCISYRPVAQMPVRKKALTHSENVREEKRTFGSIQFTNYYS